MWNEARKDATAVNGVQVTIPQPAISGGVLGSVVTAASAAFLKMSLCWVGLTAPGVQGQGRRSEVDLTHHPDAAE